MMTKSVLEVEILSLTNEGKGVARPKNAPVVFVERGLPLEKLEVDIIRKQKKILEGVVSKILSPSPLRKDPFCVYFGKCGGCVLQHINEKEHLSLKKSWFLEATSRIGKWPEKAIEYSKHSMILVTKEMKYYRKRVRFHFDGKNLGFHQKGTNVILDLEENTSSSFCFLCDEFILKHLKEMKCFLMKIHEEMLIESRKSPEYKSFDDGYQIQIEITSIDEKLLVFPVSAKRPSGKVVFFPISFYRRKILEQKYFWLFKEDKFSLNHPILDFKVLPRSFIQPHQKAMYTYVCDINSLLEMYFQEMFQGSSHLWAWDLYCGAGAFTACFEYVGKRFGKNIKTVAVEGVFDAIESLKSNLKDYQVEALCLDVEFFVEKYQREKPSLVLLDPPRDGVGEELMNLMISKMAEESIIFYVSCNSVSMARDTKNIFEQGYELEKVYLYDMFPYTVHYESLSVFVRRLKI